MKIAKMFDPKKCRINPNSEAVKKILDSYSVSKDFEFVINSGRESVIAYVQHFTASLVEKQDELIMKVITRAANEEFVNITIDRNKVIEILGKHTPKKVKRLRDGVIVHCPECHKSVSVTAKYCETCGQKLDWDHEYYTEGKDE